jgi:hypothetical protein
MSGEDVIDLNVQALRNKSVPEHVIQTLARESTAHLEELKRLFPEKF